MYGAALSRDFEFVDLKRRLVWGALGGIVCFGEKKVDERVVMEMKTKRGDFKVPAVQAPGDMLLVGITIL